MWRERRWKREPSTAEEEVAETRERAEREQRRRGARRWRQKKVCSCLEEGLLCAATGYGGEGSVFWMWVGVF